MKKWITVGSSLLMFIASILPVMAQGPYEFDPRRPYWFKAVDQIDFASGGEIRVSDDFSGFETIAITRAWKDLPPETTWEKALGKCGDKIFTLLAFNTQVDSDLTYSWEDTLLYAHSGNCGVDGPFEAFRRWLEGGYAVASAQQREKRLLEIVGKRISFNDAVFEVVEAVYLSRADLEVAYEADVATYGVPRYGAIDRFFIKDQREVHELILGFCGSNGGTNPNDWFAAKYYLLLHPVVETGQD